MLSERFGDKRKMVKLGNKRRTILARYQVNVRIYICVCGAGGGGDVGGYIGKGVC